MPQICGTTWLDSTLVEVHKNGKMYVPYLTGKSLVEEVFSRKLTLLLQYTKKVLNIAITAILQLFCRVVTHTI